MYSCESSAHIEDLILPNLEHFTQPPNPIAIYPTYLF